MYEEKAAPLQRMKQYNLGDFEIIPFGVPHNMTNCDGYLIKHKNIGSMLFITDAEYCPYNFSNMQINHVMVECNYSLDYVSKDLGNYEHVLRGHMELETCKRFIQSINSSCLRSVGLLHLSGENSDAERFRREIEALVDCDVKVYVAEKGFQTGLMLEPF